jgi:hypothetical protein
MMKLDIGENRPEITPGLVEVDKRRRSLKETWRRHSRMDAAPLTAIGGAAHAKFFQGIDRTPTHARLGRGDFRE